MPVLVIWWPALFSHTFWKHSWGTTILPKLGLLHTNIFPWLLKEGHDPKLGPEVQDLFSIAGSFPRVLWEACKLERFKETKKLGSDESKQVC